MKNLFFIVALLCCALWSSCKKTPETEPVPDDSGFWGEGTALKNGVVWDVACTTYTLEGFEGQFFLGLINSTTEGGFRRGSMRISFIPFKIGVYPVIQQPRFDSIPINGIVQSDFFTTLSDGDVPGDHYRLLKDSSMLLTVDKIDDLTGEVWGTFEGTIVKDTTFWMGIEYDPNSPDTLVFENGSYHARVK